MKIKIIGLTGPSGSGKTALGEYFAAHNIPCIDADKLYHSMLIPPSECLDAIAAAFGHDVLSADGTLDRTVLGIIVFSDKKKLKLLNCTVLSIVIKEVRRLIGELEDAGHAAVLVDAPTLIESGFHLECDTVISVISDKSTRIERICARDGIARDAAQKRVSAQKDDEFYISHSDIVLYNNDTAEEFEKKIKEIFNKII